MPSPRPHRRCSAFTLIEVLVVLVVIAILSGITVGAVRGAKSRAQIAQARSELAAIATALEEFKRLYGDYPQLGEFTQASATPTSETAGPGVNSTQAKLFNCLTGAFGPRASGTADRLNGPNLLGEIARFKINGTLTNQFLVPVNNAPNPPYKPEQNVCLVDPWGRRYLYYYKNARTPQLWQATGYVLYSAGPAVATNGTQTPPITVTSGLLLTSQTAEMVDNIFANNP